MRARSGSSSSGVIVRSVCYGLVGDLQKSEQAYFVKEEVVKLNIVMKIFEL